MDWQGSPYRDGASFEFTKIKVTLKDVGLFFDNIYMSVDILVLGLAKSCTYDLGKTPRDW